MKFDGKAFGEAIVTQVRGFVDRALGAFETRIKALEDRPAAVDGKDGRNGVDGKDGRDAADGVGLAGAVIDRSGELVLTLTDGRTVALGVVVAKDGQDGRDGKDGKDGERGADGFGLDDFDTEMLADGRTILLKFVRGDLTETHEFKLPVMIYRGVFSEAANYERGDVVTWGGAMWHCDADPVEGEAPGKPVEGAKGWTLAVKRGRDGKDGQHGKDGQKGRDGRDAEQMPGARSW